MNKPTGILLTNTGTPDSASVADVRRYLAEFLSDPRIVRLPRILWRPFLHTVVLPLRAPKSAQLYQKIWTPQGAPLRFHMQKLAAQLEKYLREQLGKSIFVETGMHYGNPSIQTGIAKLRAKNIEELYVLPLFPQYSTSTTETAHDKVKQVLNKIADLKYTLIAPYSDNSQYIAALCALITAHHDTKRYLIFSFHGLPERFAQQGDPYPTHCQNTARLVAQSLHLANEQWCVAYQSRFGYAKWFTPHTFDLLRELPQRGIYDVSVICPGFAVDCLETLEEIQIRGQEEFLQHGGKSFHYIPALNSNDDHVKTIISLLKA